MKSLKLISILSLLFTMLFIVQCSDDPAPAPVVIEPDPLVKISGKITYANEEGTTANASGAIVFLAKSATATTTFSQTTIADANGDYKFVNLDSSSYFINATYYTANKNVAGRLDGMNFTTASGAIVAVDKVDVAQSLTLVSTGQTGSAFEALSVNYAWDATALKYVQNPTGEWQYDATHSPIAFEFPYRGEEADFFGAFSQLSKFVVNFDAANLATSTIDVEVDIASINTRNAGGRDPRTTIADNPPFNPTTLFTEYGCIFGTFGILADGDPGATPGPAIPPTDAIPQTVTLDADRYAQFKSTSIEKYGDGFVAKGDLKFHGFTVPVNLLFKQSPVWLDPSNNRKYSGFEGKFTMAAKQDYGITSGSVNDALIKIQISIVNYKQL